MSNIKFLSLIMNNKFNIIKEVNTTQSIMSNKEKIYVSNVLIKTINCCNINYHNLINGKKIVLKEMDENKEIKQIFAKQNKRSKKFYSITDEGLNYYKTHIADYVNNIEKTKSTLDLIIKMLK